MFSTTDAECLLASDSFMNVHSDPKYCNQRIVFATKRLFRFQGSLRSSSEVTCRYSRSFVSVSSCLDHHPIQVDKYTTQNREYQLCFDSTPRRGVLPRSASSLFLCPLRDIAFAKSYEHTPSTREMLTGQAVEAGRYTPAGRTPDRFPRVAPSRELPSSDEQNTSPRSDR
jgi:hypothetical protein